VRVTIRDPGRNPVQVGQPVASFELAPARALVARSVEASLLAAAVYTITTELLSADRIVDRIVHDVAVLDTRPADPDRFIRVSGSDFVVNGQNGIRSASTSGRSTFPAWTQDDFWAGWLRSAYYDPELVEEDLRRMKALGINLVSIQANDPKYYRNLLDFTRRCARHEIYVNLFCGLASPLAFREEAAARSSSRRPTGRQSDHHGLRHDLGTGELCFPGRSASRLGCGVAGMGRRAVRQHRSRGSRLAVHGPARRPAAIDLAAGSAFPRRRTWRVMMAAYRRFMDDATSRRWNQAHRKLREIDPHHLISFRQGNTLPHDFVFTGTPKHVDFICPEGYSIPHSEAGYFAAGIHHQVRSFHHAGQTDRLVRVRSERLGSAAR
jgi:hypothetical protein